MTFSEQNDFSTVERIQLELDRSPFQRLLGLRAVAVDCQKRLVEIELPFKAQSARGVAGDQLHGGVLATLMDVAGDYAVGLQVGFLTPTINLHVDYLRPSNGTVRAIAGVLRCGRSIGVADIKVFDQEERLVAAARGTYSTRNSGSRSW